MSSGEFAVATHRVRHLSQLALCDQHPYTFTHWTMNISYIYTIIFISYHTLHLTGWTKICCLTDNLCTSSFFIKFQLLVFIYYLFIMLFFQFGLLQVCCCFVCQDGLQFFNSFFIFFKGTYKTTGMTIFVQSYGVYDMIIIHVR